MLRSRIQTLSGLLLAALSLGCTYTLSGGLVVEQDCSDSGIPPTADVESVLMSKGGGTSEKGQHSGVALTPDPNNPKYRATGSYKIAAAWYNPFRSPALWKRPGVVVGGADICLQIPCPAGTTCQNRATATDVPVTGKASVRDVRVNCMCV